MAATPPIDTPHRQAMLEYIWKIKKFEDLGTLIKRTTASKEDIKELRSEMKAGFDRIEHLLLPKQEQRLTDLETRMKKLEDTLAV